MNIVVAKGGNRDDLALGVRMGDSFMKNNCEETVKLILST
jgi:hypothetical protein